MGARWSIPDVFGHRVIFPPYDIETQVPSIGPKGKGHHPRDPYNVFRLDPVAYFLGSPSLVRVVYGAVPFGGAGKAGVGMGESVSAAAAGGRFGNIQPEGTVRAKDSPDLAEDINDVLYK